METGGSPVLVKMRVVSFCHYLQGPAAAQYLADMGAEVIKVEPPGGAFERHWSGAGTYVEGVSAFYLAANRNKRSIAVDLKHPEAKAVIERLIASADVVMENFRPGVMERLGIGYEQAKALKPDIIYCSATGYGASGPMQPRPGQDLLIQAYSGLVAATGQPDRPTAIGFAAADQHGAALMAMGILGAFAKRLQTGEGTRIEASLLNAGLDLQTEPLTLYLSKGAKREVFHRHQNLATWFHEAPYGIYRIADGFVALSMNRPAKLAAALDSERIAALAETDPYLGRDQLADAVAAELRSRRLADLVPAFDAEGIWYQRVHDYDDLEGDPQIRHNQMLRKVAVKGGEATLVNHPLRYDGEVPPLRHLAIDIGEDTRAVLSELGYADAEIEALITSGALAAPVENAESSGASDADQPGQNRSTE
jgi:crotonobetainyl-CoA:carnitine CoA-transferase CaiB-like acyl-CoA transferase